MTYRETLADLRIEHIEIQKRIDEMRPLIWSWPKHVPKLLIELIDLVHSHHIKEEAELFPYVSRQDWLSGGGPRCSFFMGQIMDLKLHERFTQTLRNYNLTADRQTRDWAEESSPLWVPLDEHDIGTAFSVAIKDELSKPTSDQNIEKLKDLASTYLRLVEVHRQKEDECLFVLLENKLP